jgi:hypothetical protein
MRIQKLISAGFATAVIASASIPALAWTAWPDVDFEWYANVGKPLATSPVEITLASRTGYIVVPGHWETRGTRQVYVASQYVKDDYPQQLAIYNNPNGSTTYATGPFILYDKDGNVIPTQPEAYPVDSARR